MKSFLPVVLACVLVALPAAADQQAEAAAADLLHRRLENENPEDAALLRSVRGKLVVVVRGSMDSAHIGYWVDQKFAGRGVMPTAAMLFGTSPPCAKRRSPASRTTVLNSS